MEVLFSNCLTSFVSYWVYYVLIAITISVSFIKKNDNIKSNLRRLLKTSMIAFLVLLLYIFAKHLLLILTETPDDNANPSCWLMIICWPILTVAYLLIVFDVRVVYRRIIALVCVVGVLASLIYPTVKAIKANQLVDYILAGSYTCSGSEELMDDAFEAYNNILTIGQKNSGNFLEGFDLELSVYEEYDVSLAYRAHIQNIGWYEWSSEGTNITYDRGYAIDVVQFMLYGKDAFKFDVEYRIAVVGEDWQEWRRNGLSAGIPDSQDGIEAIEIRLVPTGNDVDNTWTVTQFSSYSYDQSMFYTIRNNETGTLIVVDGGGELFSQALSIINLYGGRVDYWFITHPDYEHAEGYNLISENSYGVEIGEAIDISNFPDEAFALDGLRVEFFDAIDSDADANAIGSLMFKISGQEDSILFCSDSYEVEQTELLSQYGVVAMSAEYIEVGSGGLNNRDFSEYASLNPRYILIDAPIWMIHNEDYAVYDLNAWCYANGIESYTHEGAPNRIPFD